jgi:NAD-dependent deacetylase
MKDVRERLLAARRLCALTGSGISAESGVPTFRGPGGLWRNFRPEELATPEAFARDPKLVWEWYDWRRGLIANAEPNQGHRAIASRPSTTVITQNVDELHQRAGSPNVLEVHGSIWNVRCVDCGKTTHDTRSPLPQIPPVCECGGLLRPGVVWFGEGLPRGVWDNAQQAVESCDVLLVVGTSSMVYPAASLAPFAKHAGAFVIEVNLDETPISDAVHHSIRGRAGEVLPQILQ